ncbi:MAG: gamma-glutamylcyclotransferase family protein [Nitrososphaeria archaeon]
MRVGKLEFNKISYRNPNEGFANIVPCKGIFVEGILYEINSSDLSKLDKYEVILNIIIGLRFMLD